MRSSGLIPGDIAILDCDPTVLTHLPVALQALQSLFKITPSEGALASGGQQALELVFNADRTAKADLMLPGIPQLPPLTCRTNKNARMHVAGRRTGTRPQKTWVGRQVEIEVVQRRQTQTAVGICGLGRPERHLAQ